MHEIRRRVISWESIMRGKFMPDRSSEDAPVPDFLTLKFFFTQDTISKSVPPRLLTSIKCLVAYTK